RRLGPLGGRALVASAARTLAASLPLLVWCGLAVLVWPGSRSLLVDVLWLGGTIAGAVGLFWSASVVLDLPERTGLLRMLPRAERRMSAVRGLYRHLLREGALERDPTEHLEAPRRGRSLPRTLSRETVTALVEAPDIAEPRGVRDRAILELLYATGMRASEF